MSPPPSAHHESLLETLGAVDVGVLQLDADGRILAANDALVRALGIGLPPARLVGGACPFGPATFEHAYADPAAARERFKAMARAGRRVLDDQHRLADGTTLAHTYSPVTEAGETSGQLWVVRPVAVPTSEEDPERREPAESREWRALFASALAHEVRTPATSIAAFASVLDDPELDEAGRSSASQAIGRNADRLLAVASDLVLISDLERGDRPRTDERVSLADLVQRSAPAGIVVRVGHGCERANVSDPRLLRLAVHAAMASVLAVTSDPAGVSVELVSAGREARLTVSGAVDQPVTTERLLALRIPDRDDPAAARTAALSLVLARIVARYQRGELRTSEDSHQYTASLQITHY